MWFPKRICAINSFNKLKFMANHNRHIENIENGFTFKDVLPVLMLHSA